MNYKDIVEKLFEEIKKEFDTAIYRKDWNYIQFPIESIFGTHIELWLVDKEEKLYLDFHQEKNATGINEPLFDYLDNYITEKEYSDYEIIIRQKNNHRILRQKKTYQKEDILNKTQEIITDVKKFKDKFENIIEEYLKNIKNLDLSIIKEEHVLKAIAEYDINTDFCKGREAVNWDLLYQNKNYPHKCIVGRAYNIANNESGVLNSYLYSSVCEQNYCASKILRDLGFELKERNKSKATASSGEGGKDMTSKQPLNQILYGPPGTGKTYNTINKALEIILEQQQDDNIKNLLHKDSHTDKERKKLKDKFEEYKKAGQIEFVTFHQSYGYEEFVEGIKPCDLNDCESSGNVNIKYSVQSGIFKDLSKNAQAIKISTKLENFDWQINNIFKMSLGGINESNILDWCLDNSYIAMGWGRDFDFSEGSGKSWEQYRDYYKEKLKGRIEEKDIRFTLQAMGAFQNWLRINDLVFVSFGNRKIIAIGQVVGEYEYKENNEIDYYQLRKVKWIYINRSGIDADRLLNRRISQQTIYNISKDYINKDFFISLFDTTGQNNYAKNYILIIDEINRGNISKIFGELITLIEDSKRLGKSEQVEITLPYSGEKFGVPSNLYIIGTMNTADRSIAQIDTALRRRFEFIEMMPNYKVLCNKSYAELTEQEANSIESNDNDLKITSNQSNCEINIRLLLKAINERIEYIYDREHQIGHSYFMPLKKEPSKEKLDEIFRVNIIPLLAEYFYGDWADIKFVLNDMDHKFIMVKEESELKFAIGDSKRRKNKIYNVNPTEFSCEAYKNIYAPK